MFTLKTQISNLRVESELLAFKLARLLSPDTTSSKSTGDPSEQGTVSPSNMNNVPWESWQDNPVAYLEPSYLSKKFDTDINKINQNTKTEADQLRKENDILRCALESLSRDNQEMGSRLVEMAFSSGILSSEVINDEKITNDASYDPQSSIGTLSYDFLVDDNEALPSNTASPSSQAPEGPKTPLQLPSNATTSEEIYLSLGKSKSRLYDDI